MMGWASGSLPAHASPTSVCVSTEAQEQLESQGEYQALLEVLQRPIPKELHQHYETRWKKLESLCRSKKIQDRFHDRSDPISETIAQDRLGPSGTFNGFVNGDPEIERASARKGFDAADQQVQNWIKERAPITVDRLSQLQRLLNQDPNDGGLRTDRVYGSGRSYLNPSQVPTAMADLVLWVESNPQNLGTIELAAKAYQRMVSIHPFGDANGRTSRMLMDWILLREGLLPPTFEKVRLEKNDIVLPASVAVWAHPKTALGVPVDNLPPESAIQVVTRGIERTLHSLNQKPKKTGSN